MDQIPAIDTPQYPPGVTAFVHRWTKTLHSRRNLFKLYSMSFVAILFGLISIMVWNSQGGINPGIGEAFAFAMMGILILARIQAIMVLLLVGRLDFGDELSGTVGILPISDIAFARVMGGMWLRYTFLPFILLAGIEAAVYWFGDQQAAGLFHDYFTLRCLGFVLGSYVQSLAAFCLAFSLMIMTRRVSSAVIGAALLPVVGFMAFIKDIAGNSDTVGEYALTLVFPGFWIWGGDFSHSQMNSSWIMLAVILVLGFCLLPLIPMAIKWRRNHG